MSSPCLGTPKASRPSDHRPRRLFMGALLLLTAGLASCGCPSFFNSNCSMDVLVQLDGPAAEINGGLAFQVSVVVLEESDPASAKSNREWIREGGRLSAVNPRIDFSVQSGQIRVSERNADSSMKFSVAEDGRSIDIDFKSLGHPEKGGYSRLAVFADMRDQLDDTPRVVPYGVIKGNSWRVSLTIAPGGIQIVRDESKASN